MYRATYELLEEAMHGFHHGLPAYLVAAAVHLALPLCDFMTL